MRQLDKIQTLVNSGRFDEARFRLLNLPQSDSLQSTLPENIDTTSPSIDSANLVIIDRGNGRVSQGLRFLELVSLSFRGRELNSVLSRRETPIFVPIDSFSSQVNNEDRVRIVAKSLGVLELLQVLPPRTLDMISKQFIPVFSTVVDGNFLERENRRLLRFCRHIASRVLNISRGENING